MTDPTETARQLLRDTESYLSALHGSVARHDNLAANLGCAGCELRGRIAGVLPTLTDLLPPPADRAAVLREAPDTAEDIAGRLHREGAVERSQGAYDVMDVLRKAIRMAVEAQPTTKPEAEREPLRWRGPDGDAGGGCCW